MALPFLPANAKGYLTRAFQLNRIFLYKWTVNWRFVEEKIFLSREFATALLICHASILVLFISTRWTRPSGRSMNDLVRTIFKAPVTQQLSLNVTPEFVMTTILSSMVIGLLCARSLHYQFYAYITWVSPVLLWKAGLHSIFIYLIWTAQEWAWNVYPSTKASSMVVVGCLVLQVFSVWWGTSRPDEGVCQDSGRTELDHMQLVAPSKSRRS